jgi:type IV secretory pathway TraG/TraD family ATPase VirD4
VLLDELAGLQRLPALERLLMRGRKYNAAVAMGFQTFAGLRGVYGRDAAINLLGNCHTRIVHLLTDPETAEEASRLFGNVTTLEPEESVSMGQSSFRDGMTFTYREVTRRLIAPEEFLSMKRLTAYVRLPEDYPATMVTIEYQELPIVTEAFVEMPKSDEPADGPAGAASARPPGPDGPKQPTFESLADLADELSREH